MRSESQISHLKPLFKQMASKTHLNVLNRANDYSLWGTYEKAFHAALRPYKGQIIREILDAAAKYPQACASCRFGIPPDVIRKTGFRGGGGEYIRYRNLKKIDGARTCALKIKGYNPAQKCPEYLPHTALRLWREALGMSRAELAKRAGKSVDTVISYELGRRGLVKIETIAQYAKALGIDPADLVTDFKPCR